MTDRPIPASLPTGSVTFLLTDIEESTARWEQAGDAFAPILTSHHALLRREFGRHGGREVKEMGDGFLIVFERAAGALACAVAGQRALAAHSWPTGIEPPRVRMALHSGEVELREGEYRGLVLHYAQRMLMAGCGGQILCSETAAALLDGELGDVRLVNLGCYHLRGAATAFRLFQVEYRDMPRRDFPLPDAVPAHVGSLPLPSTRFFGRETEMAWLQELLGRAISDQLSAVSPEKIGDAVPDGRQPPTDSPRLITLTGPGGAGKTRLALQAAARLGDRPCQPIWFVPLADLMDPLLIGDRVLAAVGLPRDPTLPALEQVIAVLSAQPTLLVLDDMEHLVKGGASLIQILLDRVPALMLLVTSRRRLRLPGEYVLPVPPLAFPGDSEELERVLRSESVRMFTDRAQAVRPDFQVTQANAAALATLCRQLEGSPLAIELAAARAGVRTPQMMLDQLGQGRFEILVSRQSGGVRRQSSLWAAIEWSYQLLPPELRQLFARLSVFRGGWTAEAAEVVCGASGLRVLDGLEELRESALVLAEMAGAEIRFRLSEPLREFGARQLSLQGQADTSRRHAEYYLSLAERAEPELTGARQGEWLDRLERDHDNFRAALDWCQEGVERRLGLRLGAALWLFWRRRGCVSEGRERLLRLLALTGAAWSDAAHPDAETTPPLPGDLQAVRARALHGAGCLSWLQGDFAAARSLLQESLAIRRKRRDRPAIGQIACRVGLSGPFSKRL